MTLSTAENSPPIAPPIAAAFALTGLIRLLSRSRMFWIAAIT
jgi:hypothetical protein